jgi:hypothetical protein
MIELVAAKPPGGLGTQLGAEFLSNKTLDRTTIYRKAADSTPGF